MQALPKQSCQGRLLAYCTFYEQPVKCQDIDPITIVGKAVCRVIKASHDTKRQVKSQHEFRILQLSQVFSDIVLRLKTFASLQGTRVLHFDTQQ